MSRVGKRAGTKALICHECVKATTKTPGKTARNVGSFRGRPAAFIRHLKNGHGRKSKTPVLQFSPAAQALIDRITDDD